MRSTRRVLTVFAVVAAMTVLSGPSASAAETKTLNALKDCGSFPTPPVCVITDSNLKILRGAAVTYTALVFYADHLTSPVTLQATDKRESTATGQCTFYFAGPTKGNGHCEYWSGTGKLAGFNAAIIVGTTTIVQSDGVGFVNSLTGTYWFDRQDNDDNDGNDD
ncbi:MAG: hypothetical protein M3P38_03555 [Chloroflexota bacterium]|nr:hypothetical protein [Chloroflexota bacterium]